MLNLRAIFDDWFHFLLYMLPIILFPYFSSLLGGYALLSSIVLFIGIWFKDIMRVINSYPQEKFIGIDLNPINFSFMLKFIFVGVLSMYIFSLTTLWLNLTILFLGMLIINDVIFVIDHLINGDQELSWKDYLLYIVLNLKTSLVLLCLASYQIITYSVLDPMLLTTALTVSFMLISSIDLREELISEYGLNIDALIMFHSLNIVYPLVYSFKLFFDPNKTIPVKSLINFYDYVSSGELLKDFSQYVCVECENDPKNVMSGKEDSLNSKNSGMPY